MTALAPARSRWIAVLAVCALLAPAAAALAQAPAERRPRPRSPRPRPPTPSRPRSSRRSRSPPRSARRTSRRCRSRSPPSTPTSSLLLAAGGADVKALSGRVPSLLLESSFGRAFPRFYIRGLGNTDFDLNASQPVSMVVDDVVLENPVVKGMPLFDLRADGSAARPAGLAVRPQHAGRRRQVRHPQAHRRSSDGYARVSYGTYDNVDVKAAVGGGLTETLSARASVLYQSQSDWVDNTFTGENDALGGQTTSAGRVQLLWEPSEKFDALLNVHGWKLDGTARIFRANILKPGPTIWSPASSRTRSRRTASTSRRSGRRRRAQARLRPRQRDADLGHRLRDARQDVQPRRHRRRLRRGLRAALRPGLHPVLLGDRRRHPRTRPVHPGAPPREPHRGRWDWLFGLFYFDESLKAETFSYDVARARQPGRRLRVPDPGRDLVGALRLARLPADRPLEPEGRPALHDRREGLLGRAARPDLPAADRAPDPGLDRRRPRHLGPLGHVQGDRERQPVRPRRHRLPRALDPGAHPLLRRLRGRHEPGDELRLRRRRGEDHLVRGRREDRDRPQAAPQRRRLRVQGRRAADRGGGRPVQHRDAAQRRQDEGLRLRGRPRLGALVGLALHARGLLQPHRDRRPEPRAWRPAAAAARSPT